MLSPSSNEAALPIMDLHLYEEYARLLAAGCRKEAAVVLRAFIQAFNSFSEREQWTGAFLRTHAFGAKIRHELYAEVIFPVLLAGSKRKDAWSLYWLAGTSQNLYGARQLHEQVGFKDATQLLKDAFAVDPNSISVRLALLDSLLSRFAHAAHEWPRGILWGMDGATLEQCNELMREVSLARELDGDRSRATLIDEFERKLHQYRGLLISRS